MNPARSLVVRAMMTLACLIVASGALVAGGFSIYEQGAAATAQGGAFVARAWDASAGFYNPAGLAMYGTPGQWRFYGGITPVQSQAKMTGLDPFPGNGVREKAVDKWFPPFFLHGSYQLNEKVNLSLSVTTPFGLGTEWENDNNTYSGRFRSILADIQVVYVSPTFSYKVNDKFAAGVGLDYVYSKVKLERHSGQAFFNGTDTRVYDVINVKLDGSDNGSFGFHVAAMYKANEQWSFGVDYKHSVSNKYDGTAKFNQITTGISLLDANVASTLANPAFGGTKQDGSTKVEFPNSFVVGAAYKPNSKLSLEADFCYFGWSVFEEVEIKFPESQILATSVLEENYDNTWQIRVGGEYWVSDKFAVRAGYIFDKTPAPTETVNPLLPDADRHDIGLGIGYKLNNQLNLDVSYLSVNFTERSTKSRNVDGYDGIYKSHVNLFAVGIGYAFGGQ